MLWSTVLTSTLVPVFAVKALKTLAYAFFGTGSEAFEPNVTVPAVDLLKIDDARPLAEAPPAESPYAAAAPAAPVTRSLRRVRDE